jgi:hypothetical protein
MASELDQSASMDEEALLREARQVVPPLPAFEPRAGFAASVALAARDQRIGDRFGVRWLRWAAGGLAVAGVAAGALVMARPHPAPSELLLAQRLDLYEDMAVLQHQEALEDLDVVSVLHELQPEGKP